MLYSTFGKICELEVLLHDLVINWSSQVKWCMLVDLRILLEFSQPESHKIKHEKSSRNRTSIFLIFQVRCKDLI